MTSAHAHSETNTHRHTYLLLPVYSCRIWQRLVVSVKKYAILSNLVLNAIVPYKVNLGGGGGVLFANPGRKPPTVLVQQPRKQAVHAYATHGQRIF